MPRITLANWYRGKAPGDTVDVDAATPKSLRRDGRVASVEDTPQQVEAAPAVEAEAPAQPQPEPAADSAPPAGAEPPAQTGRRKR
jgi:hypothetical protein